MKSLQGKVALVTGAASGLGKAIAEAYAQSRSSIALHTAYIWRRQGYI